MKVADTKKLKINIGKHKEILKIYIHTLTKNNILYYNITSMCDSIPYRHRHE